MKSGSFAVPINQCSRCGGVIYQKRRTIPEEREKSPLVFKVWMIGLVGREFVVAIYSGVYTPNYVAAS